MKVNEKNEREKNMVMLQLEGTTKDDFEPGQGGDRPEPGMYHTAVEWCNEKVDDGYVEVSFVVLAGKPDGQAGKSIRERFHLQGSDDAKTKTCHKRLGRLALVLGLITEADLGKNVNLDFSACDGRQCVIKVVEREGKDREGNAKKYKNVDFMGFWSLDDKDVANVPKDESMASTAINQPAGPIGAAAADDYGDVF